MGGVSNTQPKTFSFPKLVIDVLPLDKSEKNILNRTVKWYAKPEGIFKTIAYVFYRAFNAIKAIFGKSDWQKSEKILSNMLSKIAMTDQLSKKYKKDFKDNILEEDKSFIPFKTISNEVDNLVPYAQNYLANVFLKSMVEVQENNQAKISEKKFKPFENGINDSFKALKKEANDALNDF